MLSGELDLRTPLEGARADAAAWPASRLLEIPNTGHSVLTADLSGCAARAARRFLRGRSGPTSCRRGRNPFPATPPLPASLRALRPIGGVAGDRGRVIRALELTLYDVAEDYLVALLSARSDTVRGAGLRGGRWSWASGRPLRLERVELVPGVRVSGRVRRFGTARQSARLRISGTPRASGRLVLRGGRVSGRLGGRRASADIFLSLIGAAGAGAGGAVGAGADGAAGAGADGAAGAGADGRMPLPELLRAGRELASRARAR